MKKLALILALITVIAACVIPVSADEGKVVQVCTFDTAVFNGGSLDEENQFEGTGCHTFKIGGNNPDVFEAHFDAVDVSGCDYVAFWFFVSDASKLEKMGSGQLEFTSSGRSDQKEAYWYLNGAFGTNFMPEGPKDGWNLVRMPIKTPDKFTNGEPDWTNFNFFRMYFDASGMKDVIIRYDDMFAYTEGADISAHMKKAEAATEAPATDAPAPATDAPVTPVVDPTTFDAASSIAVVAVAAMGVVLVASKKRH